MDDLVQSAPFMPPIHDTTHCQIFVVGDLTVSFEQDLSQLLHVKESAYLQSFIDQVASAFREEFASLPLEEQKWLPRFTSMIDLVANLKGSEGEPALRVALICLYEIGRFIRFFEESGRPYPRPGNTLLLGLCAGSFATAAIATSQTIADLIPVGAEVVLVAFRVGIHSLRLQKDLDRPFAGSPRSWSAIVASSEEEAIELIENFGKFKSLPAILKPYLSAVSTSNVTISGPPSLLDDLLRSRSLKGHHLPINSPYHASHLYKSEENFENIWQLRNRRLETYKVRFRIVSPSSGDIIAAESLEALLQIAVRDALCNQIRWDKILQSCAKKISQHNAYKNCSILPLASNAATLLSSALMKNTELLISINDALNRRVEVIQPAIPTGKFEDSKIAIIGFSGRFPEAASNEEFWQLLRQGRDVHRTIPSDRFDWKAHHDPTGKRKNTSRVQHGCFINDPGLFDARFFNLSPREAENTDPAQRLALATTYEAIEMAGLVPNRTPSTQQDRIGVFFGVTSDDWREVNSGQNIDTYFIPGGNRAFVPGRISYFFGFSGPSLSIDTACSSSFASIQTACSYLWRGGCDTAIAGGVNVLTNPDNFAGLDRGHFLSTTGNCNAFDDEASGYCRADAIGSVILKRLEDAQADNDPVFGVIAGANTNHSAHAVSITRPHEGDQISLFKRIIRHANINPLDVCHIEMHGTGTQAGDATEMNSVLSVFVPGNDRMPRYPLHLGSVKANIGHSEAASGVSSLIKVLLMMQKNEIPPHCGIKTKINHNYPLDLADRNVRIPFKPTRWHRSDFVSGKRVVFLNNFSAAGGNTAILLEDAPCPPPNDTSQDLRGTHIITVSAKTVKSLKANINSLISFLEHNPDTSLPGLSYTTTARRIHHRYRTVFMNSSLEGLTNSLKARVESSEIDPVPHAAKVPKVTFVFTGQGSFYTGLGKQLFETNTHFKSDILRYDRIAQLQGFATFLSLMDGSVSTVDGEIPVVTAHLALTCVQMALSRLWVSWGITPSSTVGHSLGEFAALFAAGVLTATDTIHLVGTRALLIANNCTSGSHSMLAVKAPLEAVKRSLIESSCEIACLNQPSSNVISGPKMEICRLLEEYRSSGYECTTLDIPYAFHSAQVDPILQELRAASANVRFNTPSIPYISPLLKRMIHNADDLGPDYFPQACRGTVDFQGALETAMNSGGVDQQTVWLEIGPHPVCSGMINGIFGTQSTTLASLRKSTDAWKVIAETLEALYMRGVDVQWNEFHRDFRNCHKVLNLPSYSWDLKNYWIQYRNNFCLTKGDDGSLAPQFATERVAESPALPSYKFVSPSIQRVLEEKNSESVSSLLIETDVHDPRLINVIQGHKVNSVALCPSSLYADMALTIAEYMLIANGSWSPNTGLDCSNVKVERPLIVSGKPGSQFLRVTASADWTKDVISLTFFSTNEHSQKLTDHATCCVTVFHYQNWEEDWKRNAYLIKSRITSLHQAVNDGNAHKMKRGMVYRLFGTLVDYSEDYQGIQEVVLDSLALEATAKVNFQVGEQEFYRNPCWIDSLGHLAGFIMNGNDHIHSKDQVFINHGWDHMRCATKLEYGKTYETYNKMQLAVGTLYIGDTYVLDDGKIVAIFEGVKFQGVPRQTLDQLLPSRSGTKTVRGNQPASISKATPAKQQKAVSMMQRQKTTASHPKAVSSIGRQSTQNAVISDIVSRTMAIILEEARIDVSELKPTSEFADYGIDSLMSLTISGRLQEELGLNISSSIFVEYPTIKELKIHLEASASVSSASFLPSGATTPDSFEDLEDNDTDATSVQGDETIMDTIRITISEETGIPLEDFTFSMRFSELGIDSLLTLTVMGRLAEKLEMDLPPTLLTDNDTLLEVQRFLEKASIISNAPIVFQANSEKQDLIVAASEQLDQALQAAPHATSVRLQGFAKTATKTLFLFPDGSGSATSYAPIPEISPATIVYGLNCPWMRTPQDLKCSLETYTGKYLAEIRRIQPKGPYYFGGWSAGGICAYEAAVQLARAGEMVEKLILIDSPNPIGLENPPQRMYDFFESLDFFGMNGKTPPSWLRPHFDAFIQMLDDYKVKPFDGPKPEVHIIYAKDGICKNPGDPRPEVHPDDPREMLWLLNNRTDFSGAGWLDLVGAGNMKIQILEEVNHFSMMAPGPKSHELAAFIAGAMA